MTNDTKSLLVRMGKKQLIILNTMYYTHHYEFAYGKNSNVCAESTQSGKRWGMQS